MTARAVTDTDAAYGLTTGGRAPDLCFAPVRPSQPGPYPGYRLASPGETLRMAPAGPPLTREGGVTPVLAPLTAEAVEALYADCLTTGQRPPHECRAPLRRALARTPRGANLADSDSDGVEA
jgi:hypothetical protein